MTAADRLRAEIKAIRWSRVMESFLTGMAIVLGSLLGLAVIGIHVWVFLL